MIMRSIIFNSENPPNPNYSDVAEGSDGYYDVATLTAEVLYLVTKINLVQLNH
jgi:hypothetical protein